MYELEPFQLYRPPPIIVVFIAFVVLKLSPLLGGIESPLTVEIKYLYEYLVGEIIDRQLRTLRQPTLKLAFCERDSLT